MAVSIPLGFRFAGVHAGIKRSAEKEDLTLVHCPGGAVAAGTYTTNLVHAAPVVVDRGRTPSNDVRVVIVNSGNANACTGERGLADAREMTRLAAGAVVAAQKLGADEESFLAAARGILTTDKGVKVAGRTLEFGGAAVRIAGMCKGAGMIGPKMGPILSLKNVTRTRSSP